MSTKTTPQQPRRAPLSLTGASKQHQQNHNAGKSTDSNGNANTNATVKIDNKLTANQKPEPATTVVKELMQKEVKKQQHSEKKQPQPQIIINDIAKKSEKVDEKKAQNGIGKSVSNGGSKEKQENGNGASTSAVSPNENGNTNAKSLVKSSEKVANAPKEDIKGKEQQSTLSSDKNDKEKEADKKKEKEPEKVVEKDTRSRRHDAASENEKKKENEPEKVVEKETRSRRHDAASESEKKKENEPEKVVEKETRSRRHDPTSSPAENEKKKSEKSESFKSNVGSSEGIIEVGTPTSKASVAHTKDFEKISSSNTVEKSNTLHRTKTVTTVVDDIDMEPLAVELSPAKQGVVLTPGNFSLPKHRSKQQTTAPQSEIQLAMQSSGTSPDRNNGPRTFTQIAGRRSIRPISEYTPSNFQSNQQFRESYRRINTELDVSSTTNTSMNVTVGSEVPNNSSFSFFGRGRKRDRTPPPSQSAMEMQANADFSPPKRARLDMYSFFNVVASPLTMLRSRFSKASLQSSTPVKANSKLVTDDQGEVQNVSAISIEGEMVDGVESEEKTATTDVTMGKKMDDDLTQKTDSPMKDDEKSDLEKWNDINIDQADEDKSAEMLEVAAGIADTSFTSVKNKRCNIM